MQIQATIKHLKTTTITAAAATTTPAAALHTQLDSQLNRKSLTIPAHAPAEIQESPALDMLQ